MISHSCTSSNPASPRASRRAPTERPIETACFALLLCLVAWSGCASEDNGDGTMTTTPPVTSGAGDSGVFGTGVTPLPDSGTGLPMATPDSGGLLPHTDAGLLTPDSGTTIPTTDGGGTGVVPDAGGATHDGGTPDAGGTGSRPDQGMGDGKDVITIGDSWMAYDSTEGIQTSLEKVSSRDYRNYAVPGTKLLDEVIPNQYEAAKKEGPIKTVIMTGGGNDILQDTTLLTCGDSLIDSDPSCKQQIDMVAVRLQKFWAEMAQDGVLDVLIMGYSHKANILDSMSKSVDYSAMKINPLCNSVPAPLRCTALDSDMLVPSLMLRDGIHPDAAGYEALGTAIWKTMQDKGMRR